MEYQDLVQNIFADTSLFFGVKKNFHILLKDPRSFYIVSAIKKNEKQADFMFKNLSKTFNVSKSAITQGINRAEREGYIKRKINFKNRRLVTLEITEKGEQFYQGNCQIVYSLVKEVIEKVGEETFVEFVATSKVIFSTIQELGEKNNEEKK